MKKIYIYLLIIIVSMLFFNGCISGTKNLEVSLSVDGTDNITTSSPITFCIELNMPLGFERTSAYLKVEAPDSTEKVLSAERISNRKFKVKYVPEKNGNYSFTGGFVPIGGSKGSYEDTKKINVNLNPKDFPELVDVSLSYENSDSSKIKVLDADDNYVFKAVVAPETQVELNLTVQATKLTGYYLSINEERKVTEPMDVKVIRIDTSGIGKKEYSIQFYDSESSSLGLFGEPQKIQLIVTNDSLSPEIGVNYSENNGKIEIDTSTDSEMMTFEVSDEKANDIGLYKTQLYLDSKLEIENVFNDESKTDLLMVDVPKGSHSIIIKAEDLAGHSTEKSIKVNINKKEIQSTLKVKFTDGNGEKDYLNYNEKLPKDNRVLLVMGALNELFSGKEATYTYKVENSTLEETIYDKVIKTGQQSITVSGVSIPEGKNYLSLSVKVEGKDSDGETTVLEDSFGGYVKVEDITPPELYKVEFVIDGVTYKVMDIEDPSTVVIPTKAQISNKEPTIRVYFKDNSKINRVSNINILVTGNGYNNKNEVLDLNTTNLGEKRIVYSGKMDSIFINTDYHFDIDAGQIEDEEGNYLRDKDNNKLNYNFSITIKE